MNEVRNVLEKNSQYPTNAMITFCQEPANEDILELNIYEGENYYVKDNYFLGNVIIKDIPPRNPDVCDNIIFEFIIDKNGIATVEAKTNDKYGKVKKYNITINIDSNRIEIKNIKNIKKNMINWYPKHHTKIKSALNDQIQ